MRKTIESIVKAVIYLTFFVPLIVAPTSFIFPFIVPKILTLRSLIEIAMAGYALLLVINWQEYKPKFTPVTLALSVFVLSFAISTFAGVDAYHSFWDNHERMLGLFTILHYAAYFFICAAVFKTWSDWKWALRIFLLAGSIVMFIGALQTQNPQLLLNGGSPRVASTLGNSIYVGGYGLFLIFVSAFLFAREKNVVWRYLTVILAGLAFLGMFFSGTRGSILGFLAGCAVAVIGYIVVLKEYPRTRKILVGAAVLGVIMMSILYAFRKTDFVSNLPAIGRTVNTSLSDVKNSPRWIAWEISIESWKAHPLFGWGPNNFFYAFNAHYNPRSLDFGYGETWFDNAHNILMNTLAVQGIFGLLAYLSLFAVSITSLVLAWRRGANMHWVVIGSAFLAAHLVQNVTVFENPTSYLYFMFWLALVNCAGNQSVGDVVKQLNNSAVKPSGNTKLTGVDKPISIGLIGTVTAITALVIFIFNIQPARANSMTLRAIRYLSQDPVLGLPYSKEALAFNSPHIDDIRSDIARTIAQLLSGSKDQLGTERSLELFNLAYEALKMNLVLHPLDIRNQITLAQLAQQAASINKDVRLVYDAEGFLADAVSKSPRRQQIIYSLSGIQLQLGKGDEAIKLLEQCIADNPRIAESYWRLAFEQRVLGNVDKARAAIQLAHDNGANITAQDQATFDQISSSLTNLPAPKPVKIINNK